MIYSGTIEVASTETDHVLNRLYSVFNSEERSKNFKNRSVSINDIIEVNKEYFRVETAFKKITVTNIPK